MDEQKPYHHPDLKNTLVAAGLAILAEQGINGLNLRAVARRAGVSHTAPYCHFANKEALIVAIAEDGFRRLGEQLGAAKIATLGGAKAQLVAVGRAYIGFAVEQPDSFRVMFSHIIAHREQHLELCALAKACFQLLQSVITAGQAGGEFAIVDSIELTKSAWSMLHGLASLLVEGQFAEGGQDAQTQEKTIRFHLERMLAALALIDAATV
jgi:AcrR family transcriptional regulator